MKNFTTMTEKEILYAALHSILELWEKEYDILQKHPDDQITKARLAKQDERYAELHARILEIEASEH